MELTELTRKYLLDSADLIMRIADSMLCIIHNTTSVTELECYVEQAISIYVKAIKHTPYYNTDLVPDFVDYTSSFNSIVFGICNSDFGDYTSYIFALADALHQVLSFLCNSNYFKYVKIGVPIVLDNDLDIDPFYDELLPLPLTWIEMKPNERTLSFIYRNRKFSIKDEMEFNLCYDLTLSSDLSPHNRFNEFYRSDYSDWFLNIGTETSIFEPYPFTPESYNLFLERKGIKGSYDLERFKEMLKSFDVVSSDEVRKIKKKVLTRTQYRCCL